MIPATSRKKRGENDFQIVWGIALKHLANIKFNFNFSESVHSCELALDFNMHFQKKVIDAILILFHTQKNIFC